ncbi:MAG: hypothetical protein ACHQIL_07030 [Steroidobacterales bacterium]
MRPGARAAFRVLFGCCVLATAIAAGIDASAAAPARIEARSADLVLVGVLQGETLTIHVTRLLDNATVRDASVAVAFRGGIYPTVAQVDGGYSFQARELALPGTTAMEFRVTAGGTEEKLTGTLQVANDSDGSTDGGSLRQYGWWILNFAVCGAFLVLLARRKKPADPDEPA